MTVLFSNLRTIGYGEHTTRPRAMTVLNTLVFSLRASIGWRRAWDRKLSRQPIPAQYTMSVAQ
jgi:hypothetical protein